MASFPSFFSLSVGGAGSPGRSLSISPAVAGTAAAAAGNDEAGGGRFLVSMPSFRTNCAFVVSLRRAVSLFRGGINHPRVLVETYTCVCPEMGGLWSLVACGMSSSHKQNKQTEQEPAEYFSKYCNGSVRRLRNPDARYAN